MKKLILLLGFLLFSTTVLFAQDTLDIVQLKEMRQHLIFSLKIYRYADSVSKVRNAGFLDTGVYKLADSLDKIQPAAYFMTIGELFKAEKYNEASFVFYLAMLRFRYYNSANPHYEVSGDGALLASFHYEMSEILNPYLRTNIENYIAILRKSVDWYIKHDYSFFSKNKNPVKYEAEAEGINSLIADLEKNKEKYRKDWKNEQVEMEKNLNSSLQEIDRLLKK